MSAPFDPLGYVAGVNLDDSRFPVADLLAAETLLAVAVAARFPTLDTSPGTTIYELLVRPAALLYLTSKTQVQAALATLSLAAVTAQPALASDAVVDAILSNWGITRQDGTPAVGFVRVTVSRNAVYALAAGQQFVSPSGLVFATTSAYVVVASPTSASQLALYPADTLGDQFYFLVPVTAAAAGLAYQLAGQTQLAPQPAIPNLVSSFSFGEFSGAADGETTPGLIARLPQGLSAKNLLSRAALRAGIGAAFPTLQSVAVQGFGDSALIRGGDNIFGIKTPGRADVWVRTLPGLSAQTVPALATQVALNADGTALYTVSLSAAQSAGAYLISAVLPPASLSLTTAGTANAGTSSSLLGSYALGPQTYGFDAEASAAAGNPVGSAAEAAFSVYSTLTCQFTVAPTDRTLDPTLAVNVQTVGQPGIPAIQALLDDPDTRAACADYLVRAAVPCFCNVSPVTVYAAASVDPTVLRTALYAAITGTEPGTPLLADALVLALRNVPGVTRVDLPLRLAGRIYAPDGTTIDLASQNALVIPAVPASQVVPETVAWFVSLEDLALNVVTPS